MSAAYVFFLSVLFLQLIYVLPFDPIDLQHVSFFANYIDSINSRLVLLFASAKTVTMLLLSFKNYAYPYDDHGIYML